MDTELITSTHSTSTSSTIITSPSRSGRNHASWCHGKVRDHTHPSHSSHVSHRHVGHHIGHSAHHSTSHHTSTHHSSSHCAHATHVLPTTRSSTSKISSSYTSHRGRTNTSGSRSPCTLPLSSYVLSADITRGRFCNVQSNQCL